MIKKLLNIIRSLFEKPVTVKTFGELQPKDALYVVHNSVLYKGWVLRNEHDVITFWDPSDDQMFYLNTRCCKHSKMTQFEDKILLTYEDSSLQN